MLPIASNGIPGVYRRLLRVVLHHSRLKPERYTMSKKYCLGASIASLFLFITPVYAQWGDDHGGHRSGRDIDPYYNRNSHQGGGSYGNSPYGGGDYNRDGWEGGRLHGGGVVIYNYPPRRERDS